MIRFELSLAFLMIKSEELSKYKRCCHIIEPCCNSGLNVLFPVTAKYRGET